MAGGDTGKVDGKKRSNKQKKGTHDGCGDGKYNEGEESTNIFLVKLRDTYEIKTKEGVTKKYIDKALQEGQLQKKIPPSSDVKFRKKNLMQQVHVTSTPHESSEQPQAVNPIAMTEYIHKFLPTDYDTLISEDSTISDLNGAFQQARKSFKEMLTEDDLKQIHNFELEQVKKRDDKRLDMTFMKALTQIDNVRKCLTFEEDKNKEEEGGSRKHKRCKQATPRKVASSETDTDGKL